MTIQKPDLLRLNLKANMRAGEGVQHVLLQTGPTEDQERFAIFLIGFVLGALLIIFLFATCAHAQVVQPAIDMDRIMMIESHGNPLAHRKADDSIGLFQITPIVLKEWNNFHPQNQYTRTDLWSPAINRKIAEWYMNARIPQMLKYYGKPDTIPNRITAYNAGIKYVAKNKPLPRTTKLYIRKYFK